MGAGRKQTEQSMENTVLMRYGRHRKEVKAGQYYSIYDFCRDSGCDRKTADELARWCREKDSTGLSREWGDLSIQVIAAPEQKG